MRVNKPRHDQSAGRVDLLCRRRPKPSHGRDHAIGDTDIRWQRRRSSAIHHQPARYERIEGHHVPTSLSSGIKAAESVSRVVAMITQRQTFPDILT